MAETITIKCTFGNCSLPKDAQDAKCKGFHKLTIVKEEKDLADFKYLQIKYPDADFFVIGDRVKKEIRFGNVCGFKTIWLKRGKFASELPEVTRKNLGKLLRSLMS